MGAEHAVVMAMQVSLGSPWHLLIISGGRRRNSRGRGYGREGLASGIGQQLLPVLWQQIARADCRVELRLRADVNGACARQPKDQCSGRQRSRTRQPNPQALAGRRFERQTNDTRIARDKSRHNVPPNSPAPYAVRHNL